MGKIICGFAGIGKSYVAKNRKGWVDLESTPFNKNWELYADVAEHMASSGYNVLLSCHQGIRDELLKRPVNFSVYIPQPEQKFIYLDRFYKRGNDKEFIDLFYNNWEKMIDSCENQGGYYIYYVNEYLDKQL